MAFTAIPGFSLPPGAQLCPSRSRFRVPQSSPLRSTLPAGAAQAAGCAVVNGLTMLLHHCREISQLRCRPGISRVSAATTRSRAAICSTLRSKARL